MDAAKRIPDCFSVRGLRSLIDWQYEDETIFKGYVLEKKIRSQLADKLSLPLTLVFLDQTLENTNEENTVFGSISIDGFGNSFLYKAEK
jgi:hypothetical protein